MSRNSEQIYSLAKDLGERIENQKNLESFDDLANSALNISQKMFDFALKSLIETLKEDSIEYTKADLDDALSISTVNVRTAFSRYEESCRVPENLVARVFRSLFGWRRRFWIELDYKAELNARILIESLRG